jgi:hypothetical protein
MDDPPKPFEKLVDVSRDELLFDLEFGMKYHDGKARQRAAVDAAVATVARMIAAHRDIRPPVRRATKAISQNDRLLRNVEML